MEASNGLRLFASMKGRIDNRLLDGIHTMGFQHMSPVQDLVISRLPTFRSDCLVRAKTGTGKTLAFLLPAIDSLLRDKRLPKGQVGVLVISPTRELALQIANECDRLTSHVTPRFECHTAFGGSNRTSHLNKFVGGSPSVLVATPGRLKDYLSEASIAARFSHLRTLILDEADRMLETGFLADIRTILQVLPPKRNGWQGMCFSATVPPRVKEVVDCVLAPGYTEISTIVDDDSPTHDRVPQYHVLINDVTQTFTTLASLLQLELQPGAKAIVFGVTANMVALLAKVFAHVFAKTPTRPEVYEIHSRLSQPARTKTTDNFKKATSGVMFASDVVGRGMDFPDVDLVVQVGLPTADAYIHRVGRTARAGKEGRAVILLTQDEAFFVKVNKQLPIQQHPQTGDIVGSAESFAPVVQEAMYSVDEIVKQRAYSSYIGFFAGSGLLRQVRLDKAGLVQRANDLALRGMYCPEPPPMEAKVVGKMGLKGVPGFNLVKGQSGQSAHSKHKDQTNNRNRVDHGDHDPQRPRHSGPAKASSHVRHQRQAKKS